MARGVQKSMAKKWRMIIDVALCQGCNNCLMACKDEHVDNVWPGYSAPQPGLGQRWIDIPYKERGQYPLIDLAYLPSPCMHCDEAPCVAASGGAIKERVDGIVLIDPKQARGQRSLVDSCPWDMIFWNEEQDIAQKCTFCAHLLDQGWKEPRCAQACAVGALKAIHVDDRELAELIAAEGLRSRVPGEAHRPGVYYRNLYRYGSCFIAGSVAVEANGVVDCAKDVTVTLSKTGVLDDAGANGAVVAERVTDAFGDFKFDGLDEGSGSYEVMISAHRFRPTRVAVHLGDSTSIGCITLTREVADVSRQPT